MLDVQLAEVPGQPEGPGWGHDVSMSSENDIAFGKDVICIKPGQLYFKQALFFLTLISLAKYLLLQDTYN